MPGKKEDLRHAEAGGDPDLNFTYNELMDELKSEFNYAQREPGDITAREMAEQTPLSERRCFEILKKKVRSGELVKILVKGRGDRCPYYVFRKAK